MRKFNPEKELKKIQHGNRNKIIFGVIALLLIIAIGSSYALYQIRYSKRIIYTKVAPFNIRDVILSVKVEGESTSRTSFPSKNEGLMFSNLECDKENTTTGSWNYNNWSLILNSKGPNKCTAFFKKATPFNDIIVPNNSTIFSDPPDNNIRYVGATPNNYIWFNCSDYNNLTQETAKTKCEAWRIIGLFSNVLKSDGTREDLVKIVRYIGTAEWDIAGKNNWATSSLQKALNVNYLTPDDTGEWLFRYGYKPIKSSTINLIEDVVWNIGGSESTGTPLQAYVSERGSEVPDGAPTTWRGKITIIYPSDYGYATSGGAMGRNECLSNAMYWSSGQYLSECAKNSWIFSTYGQWLLMSDISNNNKTYVLYAGGNVSNTGSPTSGFNIYATLYLKSNVGISDGTGSNTEPYILVP